MSKHATILFLIVLQIAAENALGQNLHFSQFHNAPLLINPANTGFIPDGDYRLGANFRNQWASVLSVPYNTFSAYGDLQAFTSKSDNGWGGLGAILLRDVAGSSSLTSTKIYGSIAYHQMIGYGSLISLGFNGGMVNKRINVSNLKFPDQFNGNFFDNKIPTNVVLDKTSLTYFDLHAGINYAFFPNDNVYVNAGYAAHHINKPQESFFTSKTDKNQLSIRHTAFLNASLKLSDQYIFSPNAYFSMQSKAYEWLVGGTVNHNVSYDGDTYLIGGLYYRNSDALIPVVGLGFKDYVATFSYDVTISGLRNYNGARGAFEFSLVKHGLFDSYNGKKTQSLCPKFN